VASVADRIMKTSDRSSAEVVFRRDVNSGARLVVRRSEKEMVETIVALVGGRRRKDTTRGGGARRRGTTNACIGLWLLGGEGNGEGRLERRWMVG